jgi:hypothetical protein
VWAGGDTVSGHQGGPFSFVRRNISVNDPRATTLRGYTIPQGALQNQVDWYKNIGGSLTQHPGPAIDGMTTDEVDLAVANPASHDHITRAVIYFSTATHYPLRQIRYDGTTIVDYVWFMDLKIGAGLTASDFR